MGKCYIEKDGWAIGLTYNGIEWVEARPTWTHQCKVCHGNGYIQNHTCGCEASRDSMWGCDCRVKCTCKMVHGVGMARDKPAHPQPSLALLKHIGSKLWKKMAEIGEEMDSGELEKELAKEQALEASLKGAGL